MRCALWRGMLSGTNGKAATALSNEGVAKRRRLSSVTRTFPRPGPVTILQISEVDCPGVVRLESAVRPSSGRTVRGLDLQQIRCSAINHSRKCSSLAESYLIVVRTIRHALGRLMFGTNFRLPSRVKHHQYLLDRRLYWMALIKEHGSRRCMDVSPHTGCMT